MAGQLRSIVDWNMHPNFLRPDLGLEPWVHAAIDTSGVRPMSDLLLIQIRDPRKDVQVDYGIAKRYCALHLQDWLIMPERQARVLREPTSNETVDNMNWRSTLTYRRLGLKYVLSTNVEREEGLGTPFHIFVASRYMTMRNDPFTNLDQIYYQLD